MTTLLLAVLLAAAPWSASQAADDTASTGVPDTVFRTTLPNGLRVVLVPNRLAPVVTTELSYLAGSNDAPPGFPGTAHALEHMMFRGSEGLDADQLSEVGALLGGQYNAETSETVTKYTYTVPATHLGVVLHSEALRMRGLSLRQADWEAERGAIDQEVSGDLSSPIYNYYAQVQAILFEGTPYAHDALGTRDSFARTDAAMLRDFYQRWYAPNNAVLVIAGDVQPAEALAEVQALFSDIPARPLPEHTPIAARAVEPKSLTFTTDLPYGLVSLAYRMPGLASPDFATADVLVDVLGSPRGALYGLVPAGRALTARASLRPMADAGFAVLYAAFPDNGDPAPLLDDIRQIIADIVQNGVPPDLVAAMKRQELAQLAFRNDSISGLARSWSRALTMEGAQSPEDIARAYEAVTVEDVNRLARRLLAADQAVTAILTPRRSGEPTSGAGYGAPESFNRPPDHPVTLPDWASAALASLTLPDETDPPDVSVLPNGLRLIIQPEHVSRTVSVYGRVRQVTEIQEPPGQEGVAGLVSSLFEHGSTTRDRLALLTAVDDLAATERAGAAFSLRIPADQFEAGMRLLAEHQLHPALPEAAFEVRRKQLAQSLGGMLHTPDYLERRAIKQAIAPPGDPTWRQPTPETVMRLRHEDIRAYHDAAYRPDLTTIVIVGDISSGVARRVVTETFGDWPANGPTPGIDLPPSGDSRSARLLVPDESAVQDSVTLAESVGLPVGHPDRYALILGNMILGDGFSSRLYRDLRITTGYVYGVDSDLDWTRTRGLYAVRFGADADNVEKARLLVLRDLRDMQTTPVSDIELTRAKAQVLRILQMQRDSVPAIAGLYLRLSALGLPLESQQTAARHYLALTGQDIQRAFATWLRPDDLATVIKGAAH